MEIIVSNRFFYAIFFLFLQKKNLHTNINDCINVNELENCSTKEKGQKLVKSEQYGGKLGIIIAIEVVIMLSP